MILDMVLATVKVGVQQLFSSNDDICYYKVNINVFHLTLEGAAYFGIDSATLDGMESDVSSTLFFNVLHNQLQSFKMSRKQ